MIIKRFIKLTVILFTCLAGFLFVNRYVKFIDMSSINVEAKDGLDKKKVVIKRGNWRTDRERDAILFANSDNVWTVFDGSQTNSLKTRYGSTKFLLTYNNEYYTTFGHFITHNSYQHSYNLLLYKEKGEVYLKVDIEGINERHYVDKMRKINDTSQLRRERTTSPFKSAYVLDTTNHFSYVRAVAYGYSYAYPTKFIVQKDTIGQVDSNTYYSPDKAAKLMYFVEEQIDVSNTSLNYLYNYFRTVKSGQHIKVRNCKAIEDRISYELPLNNRGNFIVLGQIGETEFIWKTELSDIPISGDLTYKTMLLTYPIKRKEYYQPIGVHLANNFGRYIEK